MKSFMTNNALIQSLSVAWNQSQAHGQNYVTLGNFKVEKETEVIFDRMLDLHCSNFFVMKKKVRGRYLIDIHSWQDGSPEIDRVLLPTQLAIESGILPEPIGVELKKSGEKIGHAIAQCIDYRHAEFVIDTDSAPQRLDAVFLFEAPFIYNDIASVATQFRVGVCRRYYGLQFAFSAQVAFAFQNNVMTRFCKKTDDYGRKRGHR